MQDADPVESGPILWPDPAPVKKDIETPTENQHSSLFIIVKLYKLKFETTSFNTYLL